MLWCDFVWSERSKMWVHCLVCLLSRWIQPGKLLGFSLSTSTTTQPKMNWNVESSCLFSSSILHWSWPWSSDARPYGDWWRCWEVGDFEPRFSWQLSPQQWLPLGLWIFWSRIRNWDRSPFLGGMRDQFTPSVYGILKKKIQACVVIIAFVFFSVSFCFYF